MTGGDLSARRLRAGSKSDETEETGAAGRGGCTAEPHDERALLADGPPTFGTGQLTSGEAAAGAQDDADDGVAAGRRTEAARRAVSGLTRSWNRKGEDDLPSAIGLTASEASELEGKRLELGLSALSSEVAAHDDESDDGANAASNELSSQSMSSSRLMNDCESGSELNEAADRREDESTFDESTAVGGAIDMLFAEEAVGSCSITRPSSDNYTHIDKVEHSGRGSHGRQTVSRENRPNGRGSESVENDCISNEAG